MKKVHQDQSRPDPRDAKIAELTADLQRTRADFENYRKQIDAQKASAINLARLDTVRKMLPLLDDLDRAIASTPDLKPLEKSLEKTTKELSLEKIAALPGSEFDPDLHEAVLMADGDGDKEVIDEVLRPGYRYAGDLLRPAMVKVKTV
ncbi:nucleotide exchange factor GrpE [Candidatus Saccharibacteria bacterium]|nr:nucleotide exchange factor GrpE [Candidatus Saccharibacteria bacterium]MBQ9017131.1 nucleotide exchange factor GrpE [Candidatus Saccharibacteria bacterium]